MKVLMLHRGNNHSHKALAISCWPIANYSRYTRHIFRYKVRFGNQDSEVARASPRRQDPSLSMGLWHMQQSQHLRSGLKFHDNARASQLGVTLVAYKCQLTAG